MSSVGLFFCMIQDTEPLETEQDDFDAFDDLRESAEVCEEKSE